MNRRTFIKLFVAALASAPIMRLLAWVGQEKLRNWAGKAGPMKVPADQLQKALGITDVNYLVSGKSLAIVDSALNGSSPSTSGNSAG